MCFLLYIVCIQDGLIYPFISFSRLYLLPLFFLVDSIFLLFSEIVQTILAQFVSILTVFTVRSENE